MSATWLTAVIVVIALGGALFWACRMFWLRRLSAGLAGISIFFSTLHVAMVLLSSNQLYQLSLLDTTPASGDWWLTSPLMKYQQVLPALAVLCALLFMIAAGFFFVIGRRKMIKSKKSGASTQATED